MQKSILVFDFDGTIADTFDLMLRVSKTLSEKFKIRQIERREIEAFRDKTSWQIIQALKIPLWKIPLMIQKARSEFAKQMASVTPFPQMTQVLHQLKSTNCQLGIITTNSSANVNLFLKNYGLFLFDFIISTSRISQKHKHLKQIKKNLSVDHSMIYIGDETRDIEAARKAEVTSVAVTWGYNSQKALKAYKPDYLVNTPQELLEVLNKNSFLATSEMNR